jgi:hypothetical protein
MPIRTRIDVEASPEKVSAMNSTTIAAVEAARAAMPDAKTQATIALVSKTIAAVSPCVEAVERGSSVGSRSFITAIDRRLD